MPAAGVAAASGGNHGAAVAYAAMRLGHKARIFVPEISSPAKIARIRSYGAELTVGGKVYAEALAACEAYIADTGALSVHAFDQVETMLGQGSVGLELERAGAGSRHAAGRRRRRRPDRRHCRLVRGPHQDRGRRAPAGADAQHGACGWPSRSTRPPAASPPIHWRPSASASWCSPSCAVTGWHAVLVEDEAILGAQRALWETARIAAEPGAAAPLAALLSDAYVPAKDERVGVLVSGGNTTAVAFTSPSPHFSVGRGSG